jgi:hypothetical protein
MSSTQGRRSVESDSVSFTKWGFGNVLLDVRLYTFHIGRLDMQVLCRSFLLDHYIVVHQLSAHPSLCPLVTPLGPMITHG